MVSRTRLGLRLGLSFTLILGLLATPGVQGADPSSAYTPFTPTANFANLQSVQSLSLGNAYTNCFQIGAGQLDPLASSIVELTTGRDLNKKGAKLSCSKIKADSCSLSYSNGTPSCPSDKGKSTVETLFKKIIDQTNDAGCCAKAKSTQLKEALKELSCINSANDMIASQIKSVQTDMQNMFQQAEKLVTQIDGVTTDRVNQMAFIQSKLGGDKDSGNGGLLELQKQLSKVVPEDLPKAVGAFENQLTAFNQQQQVFQQRIQNQKMARARECFTTPDPQYVCKVNSTETCSFQQLIEEKFKELSRTKNGRLVTTNSSLNATVESKKAQLHALLQTIFSNMASDTQLAPITPEEVQAEIKKAGIQYRIKTPQDLQSLYATQLAQFNIPGANFDVTKLVMNMFENCYEDAQAKLNQDMSDSTSIYSQSVGSMEAGKKNVRDAFTQFYKGYGDMYSKLWSTFGQTAPLDTSACSSANTPLAGMMQCAKDLQKNLEGAYNGNTANSSVTVAVKGSSTNPITSFTFTCNGVNGCITKMQNLTTNLKTETQTLDKTKREKIQEANQSFDTLKSRFRDQLSGQTRELNKRITTLKAILAQNGVGESLNIQSIEKMGMEKTSTKDSAGNEYPGLYKMPDNLLAAIGGDLDPPLINPAAGSFDGARQGVNQALANDSNIENQVINQLTSLDNAKSDCLKAIDEKKMAKKVGAGKQIITECSKYADWCEGAGGKSTLERFMKDFSDLLTDKEKEDLPDLSDVSGIVSSGVAACAQSSKKLQAYKTEEQNLTSVELPKCEEQSKNEKTADAAQSCLTRVNTRLQQIKTEMAGLESSDTGSVSVGCQKLTDIVNPAKLKSSKSDSDDSSSKEAN
jgi:hypothetical protein